MKGQFSTQWMEQTEKESLSHNNNDYNGRQVVRKIGYGPGQGANFFWSKKNRQPEL